MAGGPEARSDRLPIAITVRGTLEATAATTIRSSPHRNKVHPQAVAYGAEGGFHRSPSVADRGPETMPHLHIGNVGIAPDGLVIGLACVVAMVYAMAAWVKGKAQKDWAIVMLLVAAYYPWQIVLVIAFSLIGWHRLINLPVESWVAEVLTLLPLIAAFRVAWRRYRAGG